MCSVIIGNLLTLQATSHFGPKDKAGLSCVYVLSKGNMVLDVVQQLVSDLVVGRSLSAKNQYGLCALSHKPIEFFVLLKVKILQSFLKCCYFFVLNCRGGWWQLYQIASIINL